MQSRLKLLIVLINLLVSRLSRLDSKLTYDFVETLSKMVISSGKVDDIVKAYKSVKKTIPKVDYLMRFGLLLLLELTFIFMI